MNGRTIIALAFGIIGVAVLVWLGAWQVERLAWKGSILAQIKERIADAPVPLPENPEPERDKYLPVRIDGTFGDEALRVLVSRKIVGAGYRLISPFDTGGRRVLVDRGFVGVNDPAPAPPGGNVTVTGNLHWPDDRGSATPENDTGGNIWYARDIDAMARQLGTDPVLVIVRKLSQPEQGVTPLPVDTAAIPNDHLQYATTWFALAVVWAVMTGYFILRAQAARKGAGR